MTEYADKLRQYLNGILSESASDLTEALSGTVATNLSEGLLPLARDQQEVELAIHGVEHIQADQELPGDESFALEAIVLPRERPVVDIINNSYHTPPAPWKHLGDALHKNAITTAIPSIGRVEIPNHPSAPYGGTAFVVGPDLLMTNRHVAETFATGIGVRRLNFISGRAPGIDFKQEVIPSESIVLNFDSVLMIHPYWDCAIVRVEGLPVTHPSLLLEGREPGNLTGREVVIVGYPAQDSRNSLELQNRIFRGIFQRKRMQPGKLQGYRPTRSYDKTVEAISHDSSTLGGNSGSAVIDVHTGRVVGLHFAGVYLEANFAVPTWELAVDSKVVDSEVNFHNPPTIGSPPPWHTDWLAADPETEGGAITAPNGGKQPIRNGGGESPLLGLDWYERINDAVLQDMIQRDSDNTRRSLIDVLGEVEADEVIKDLMSEEFVEGLFTTEPDPSLPEIVFLHGIMGGHLANQQGSGSRVWFNFLAFAKGNVAEKMTLGPDGFTDRHQKFSLSPDGHLRLKYAKAARRWRKNHFMVHEFTFDWRKPIHTSADQLNAYIEQLAIGNPNRRFALVAHSMGGLVASVYAQRHPTWSDRIQRAVFAGSPLGGSYAPIEAVLGVYPFFKTLAALSRHDDIPDLRQLAATLPGMLNMLPDPNLFPDPADYFTLPPWPGGPRPLQRWLDQSRNIKSEILASPLLSRTSGLVSREHGTVASIRVDANGQMQVGPRTGPGDGTVPIRASAVPELSALWEVTGDRHADLFKNKGVIKAVADLLRSGTTSALDRIRVEDIDFTEVLPESEVPEVTESSSEGVRARIDEGRLTGADLDWLLDPLRGSPPP